MFVAMLLLFASSPAESDTSIVVSTPMLIRGTRRPASMEEALEESPGIRLIRRGPTAAEPLYRGAGVGRFAVTLDGARLQGACTDHMDPASSYLEPQATDTLVLTNGNVQVNSAGGVVGSLDIPLRRPPVVNTPLTVRATTAAATAQREALMSATAIHATQHTGSATTILWRHASDYIGPNGKTVPLSGESVVQFSTRLEWRPTELQTVSLRILRDHSEDIGFPGLPMDAGRATTTQFGIGHTWRSDRFEGESFVYHNRVSHDMDDTKRDSVAMHMDMPGEAQTSGGWTMGTVEFPRGSISLKTEVWRTEQRAEMTMYPPSGSGEMFMLTWPDARTQAFRASLEGKAVATEQLTFTSGASMESKTIHLTTDLGRRQIQILSEDAPTQRQFLVSGAHIGTDWTPLPKWLLHLSGSVRSRTPDMAELWGFYLYRARDKRDQIGNPDLSPELWTQFETGISQHNQRWSIESRICVARIEDAIETDATSRLRSATPGAVGVAYWDNLGTWWRKGAEIRTTIRLSPVSFGSSFSWMQSESESGRNSAQIPAAGGNSFFEVQAKLFSFAVRTSVEWALPQRDVDATENEPSSDGYAIPQFMVRSTHNQHSGWHVVLENPLDQTWRSHLDWGTAPRPGRGIRVELWVSR